MEIKLELSYKHLKQLATKLNKAIENVDKSKPIDIKHHVSDPEYGFRKFNIEIRQLKNIFPKHLPACNENDIIKIVIVK